MSVSETSQDHESLLRPLLDHLAHNGPSAVEDWEQWHISRIGGGANNLLYRATGPPGDFATKFALRDARDRAGREYNALLALHRDGLSIAPEPVLLDRDRYALPVVVQTWLPGKISPDPPAAEEEWRHLLEHVAAVHTITPERSTAELPDPGCQTHNAETYRQAVQQNAKSLPSEAQPKPLRDLLHRLGATRLPEWPPPSVTLCRLDYNIRNFIRRPEPWASVDWENSLWGDPALDIAEWMMHPTYMDIPASRWEWVIDEYATRTEDAEAVLRIRTYHRILAVRWVVRLARFLYEVPRGLDPRLMDRPADWQEDMQMKYDHYLRLAQALIE